MSWMLQWNAYVPGVMGATKVTDFPPKMFPVSNAASSAESVCVSVPTFFTVTVAPGGTVIGAPNAKFLIVMVSAAAGAAGIVVGSPAPIAVVGVVAFVV